MRLGIAMSFVVGLLIAADAPKNGQSLQGTWTLSGGEADGKPLTDEQLKDGRLVIKGNAYTVTLPDRTVTGRQKLDLTKEPRTIDIKDATGPNKGKVCLGIYELKGNEFRVAFAQPGKARPTKFATEPNSGQWMHVWKRVKD